MPRTARSIRAGICYHVINRGNARATVYQDSHDYRVFLRLASESSRRSGTDTLAYCLMPNHFHFVLRPVCDEGLARWAHWLLTSYVQHYLRRHGHVGRVWQGRFKAFPIQYDEHLFAVMRYVEGNALRAGLVDRAQDWPWSSLGQRGRDASEGPVLSAVVPTTSDWSANVGVAEPAAELALIRHSVRRGTPYGDETWLRACVTDLGLTHTVRDRGRPRGASAPAGETPWA